jgi:hypothetical protein
LAFSPGLCGLAILGFGPKGYDISSRGGGSSRGSPAEGGERRLHQRRAVAQAEEARWRLRRRPVQLCSVYMSCIYLGQLGERPDDQDTINRPGCRPNRD